MIHVFTRVPMSPWKKNIIFPSISWIRHLLDMFARWFLANLMLFSGFYSLSLQMKTGCVALVLCLNITVDPPDVIKISPCARIEAWIGWAPITLLLLCVYTLSLSRQSIFILFYLMADPFSMAPPKALETIGQNLSTQYERWQPRVNICCPAPYRYCFVNLRFSCLYCYLSQARYKVQLDPTVDEVRKLCLTCRKYAKTERVLFHYNGHGVPKPTANGEIWVFNKVWSC